MVRQVRLSRAHAGSNPVFIEKFNICFKYEFFALTSFCFQILFLWLSELLITPLQLAPKMSASPTSTKFSKDLNILLCAWFVELGRLPRFRSLGCCFLAVFICSSKLGFTASVFSLKTKS